MHLELIFHGEFIFNLEKPLKTKAFVKQSIFTHN